MRYVVESPVPVVPAPQVRRESHKNCELRENLPATLDQGIVGEGPLLREGGGISVLGRSLSQGVSD